MYCPILHIMEVSQGNVVSRESCLFQEMKFITVTAYQNKQVSQDMLYVICLFILLRFEPVTKSLLILQIS